MKSQSPCWRSTPCCQPPRQIHSALMRRMGVWYIPRCVFLVDSKVCVFLVDSRFVYAVHVLLCGDDRMPQLQGTVGHYSCLSLQAFPFVFLCKHSLLFPRAERTKVCAEQVEHRWKIFPDQFIQLNSGRQVDEHRIRPMPNLHHRHGVSDHVCNAAGNSTM